jgi:hypothetical protein
MAAQRKYPVELRERAVMVWPGQGFHPVGKAGSVREVDQVLAGEAVVDVGDGRIAADPGVEDRYRVREDMACDLDSGHPFLWFGPKLGDGSGGLIVQPAVSGWVRARRVLPSGPR